MTAVKHPYDALSALRENSYDLVMSDVHMPNMNGYELQKHINEAFRLPVICEFLFPVNIYLHYMTTVNLIDTTTNVH